MSKQLNVNLAFTADTTAAKRNLDDLKKRLSDLASIGVNKGISEDLKRASVAAKDLQMHLGKAMDVNTGNLNLKQFHASLEQSKQSLSGITNDLLKGGLVGEQAFMGMAKSISNANINLNKTQTLMGNFVTTLKNAARWQISSALIHGIVGSLQSSVNYAKKLDESLNEIRIVTGKNTDEMAHFALQANKAAKELASTTGRYTEASLIFAQQGLGDKEIKERTDAVIKMSNVTKESADEVSSYMTSIWNNFQGEKENLVEYADVITALGAATAASSAEIANGLQKFSALGQQIGLSYDYAATALATVVSKTRQSEEIVGTAFKTIFARIQGLNLGETLDDGTTLNKYSAALDAVGINIKDANGNLKDMDKILDELGAKWNMLAKDEQVALAQTVAGTRQYNQLIALMGSWQSDFQKNLITAKDSAGALESQANIFGDSWEAASNRVRASMESIYSNMIPTQSVIKATNSLAEVLDLVGQITGAFGGLEGMILMVSSVMVNKFQADIAQSIQSGIANVQQFGLNLKQSIGLLNGGPGNVGAAIKGDAAAIQAQGQKSLDNYEKNGKTQMQKDYTASLDQAVNTNRVSDAFKKQIEALQQIDAIQSKIAINSQNLTTQEKEKLSIYLQQIQKLSEAEALVADQIEDLEIAQEKLKDSDMAKYIDRAEFGYGKYGEGAQLVVSGKFKGAKADEEGKKAAKQMKLLWNEVNSDLDKVEGKIGGISFKYDEQYRSIRMIAESETDALVARQKTLDALLEISKVNTDVNRITKNSNVLSSEKLKILQAIISKELESKDINAATKEVLVKANKELSKKNPTFDAEKFSRNMNDALRNTIKTGSSIGITAERMGEAVNHGREMSNQTQKAAEAAQQTRNAWELVTSTIEQGAQRSISFAGSLSRTIGAMTSVAMAANQINNAFMQWGNQDIPLTQKLLTSFMAISTSAGAFIQIMQGVQSAITAVNEVSAVSTTISNAAAAAKMADGGAALQVAIMEGLVTTAKELGTNATEEQIAAETLAKLSKLEGLSADQKKLIVEHLMAAAKAKEVGITELQTTAEEFNTLAKEKGTIASIKLAMATNAAILPITILVAAIAALGVGFAVVASAAAAAHKNMLEQARAEVKAGKEINETINKNKELVKTYEEAFEVYDKTKSNKEEMAKAARAAANAYKIEGAEVKILGEKYKELGQEIRKARKEELENATRTSSTATNGAKAIFKEAMDEGTGELTTVDKYDDKGRQIGEGREVYRAKFYNGSNGLSDQSGLDEDEYAINAAYEDLQRFSDTKLKYVKIAGSQMTIETDQSVEQMRAAYLEVQKLLGEATKKGNVLDSELYQEAYKWLEKSKEAFKDLEEAKQFEIDNKADLAILNRIESRKEEIKTLEDYQKVVAEVTKELQNDKSLKDAFGDDLEEKVKETLTSKLGENKDFETLNNKSLIAKQLYEKFKNQGTSQSEINKLLDGLDITVLAKMNIDEQYSIEQVRKTIAGMQEETDRNKIVAKVETIKGAQDKLKKNMTSEAYGKYEEESGLSWGKEGIVDYTEFLSKTYEQQRDYLNQIQANELENLKTQTEDTIAKKQAIIDTLEKGNFNGALDDLINRQLEEIARLKEENNRTILEILTSFQTLQEMDDAWKESVNSAGEEGASYNVYAEALTRLAGQYETCTIEVQAYNEALKAGNQEQLDAAEGNLKVAVAASEAAKAYQLNAELIKSQAKEIAKAGDVSLQSATRIAIANQRMNRGVKNLSSNWEKWSKAIQGSDHTLGDYNEALDGMRDALADLTGTINKASIPQDFFNNKTKEGRKHLALMGEAAKGSQKAINMLGISLAKTGVQTLNLEKYLHLTQEEMEDIGTIKLKLEGLENMRSEVIEGMNALEEAVKNGTIKAGDDITSLMNGTGQSWAEGLNEMARVTGMSVDQMNELLNQLGVETEVNVTDVKVKRKVPQYTEHTTVKITDPGDPEKGTPPSWDKTTYTTQGESIPVEEYMQVAQIGPEGKAGQAKVKFTGTSGTGNNYGGVSPSSVSGKGSKGGGGKGKSAPDKQTGERKKKDEAERYHVLTQQVERLNSLLSRTATLKDRAFGRDKLRKIQEEISLQDKLIKKYEELGKAIQKNLKSDRKKLSKIGAKFNKDGTIKNYEKLYEQGGAINEYNKEVDAFNKLDGTAQAEKDKKYKSKKDSNGNKYSGFLDYLSKTVEKRISDARDRIDKYEESLAKKEENKQSILEAKNAKFDLKLNRIQYVVDLKINVRDRDIKQLEFLLERLEDKDFHAAKALANIGKQTDANLKKIKDYRLGINELLKQGGFNKGIDKFFNGKHKLSELKLTQEALDQLESYIDGLAEVNNQLREMRTKAWEQVNTEFEKYLEKLDRGISKLEHLKKITEHYQNIVGILGKRFLNFSNELLDKMNEATVSQSQDILRANKAKLDALQSNYAKTRAIDTKGWSDQALKEHQNLLNKMEDELKNAKEAFMSSWEDSLQAAAKRYEDAVENIINKFEKTISGLNRNLSDLQENYKRAADIDDQYLADYEKIYQLTKLTREINKVIDDTKNIANKKELRKLAEEINKIQNEGTKISEYDLSVLQKKFELKKAELALKEAQNAKSNVSMVRGEDGSFSYLYTANEEDVTKAQQNYEDKLHEMQVLNTNYIKSLQENIISTQKECADALAKIKQSDYSSYEEWRAAIDRTQAYYNEKMNFYYSQLNGALTNNKNLYDYDWKNYSDLTGYKISQDKDYVDKFEETQYSIQTGFKSIQQAHEAWKSASANLLNEMSDAYMNWKNNVDTAMSLAGTSVENFGKTVQTETENNKTNSKEMADDVKTMAQEMETNFNQIIEKIRTWEEEYGSSIDRAINKNLELIESFNKLKAVMAEEAERELNKPSKPTKSKPKKSNKNDSNQPPSPSPVPDISSTDDPKEEQSKSFSSATWDRVQQAYAAINSGKWSNGHDTRHQKGLLDHFTLEEIRLGQQLINLTYGRGQGGMGMSWAEAKKKLGFDTGGYTGEWGDKSGKLAFLHQKEIVLNSDDTTNFLNAISMVRDIAKMIDLNAAAASANASSSLRSATAGNLLQTAPPQNIQIHAEFPDATDHSEIEQAFNNLINTASQYAGRTNI